MRGEVGGEHTHQNIAPPGQGLACLFTDVPGTWHPVTQYILLNGRKDPRREEGGKEGRKEEGRLLQSLLAHEAEDESLACRAASDHGHREERPQCSRNAEEDISL